MRKILYLYILFTFTSIVIAQTYNLTGIVSDFRSGKKLSFANIRINKTTKGTAANLEGTYGLKLKHGYYSIITSFIGYKSDTTNISITKDEILNFKLTPITLQVAEVTVTPGRNPAYDIIKKAIERKNTIKKQLNDYKYSAYTKGIMKTTSEFQNGGLSLSTKDTAKLKITGILENESRGFYKKPNNKKHFIVARKQTANTPPFINVLTGGTVIQSFYEDDLIFMGKSIPSPISDKALSYYYYYIEKEIAMDNKKIFQIYFSTDNTADPGFYGKLFIADSSFHLIKVDVNLNPMANPGGLFNYVKIQQQFSIFENNISLPTDYRLFAEGNYLGLAKFGFELHTIMNSYEINSNIDDDIFDSALISVIPGADKKDVIYWSSVQSIPNTLEEKKAYARIDSISNVAKTFGQDFSFLSSVLKLNKNISISGPLDLYSFNKVKGNTLNFNLFFNDAEEQRLNISTGISYGFADKILRKELDVKYLLGEYRNVNLSLRIFDKLTDLFRSSNNYNRFTSTILSLFTKYDFRDYYYTKGIESNFSAEVFPILELGAGYLNKVDKSAIVNSNFSFFKRNKKYSENEQIYNAHINAVTASFKLDFRKFIEDGFFRRRITPRSHILFEGSLLKSSKDILNSNLNFSIYTLESYGGFPTFGNWTLEFYAMKLFSSGTVPFQMLYALPGNINVASKNNSFRTLAIGEFVGDEITTIFLKHNFQDYLFKLSQIPILKDLQLQLSTHLNIALSNISTESRSILSKNYKILINPFYEFGFSIGHVLIPVSFEFTWKLNYRGENNFAFGINTIAF